MSEHVDGHHLYYFSSLPSSDLHLNIWWEIRYSKTVHYFPIYTTKEKIVIKRPDRCTVSFRHYSCLPSNSVHTNLHKVNRPHKIYYNLRIELSFVPHVEWKPVWKRLYNIHKLLLFFVKLNAIGFKCSKCCRFTSYDEYTKFDFLEWGGGGLF